MMFAAWTCDSRQVVTSQGIEKPASNTDPHFDANSEIRVWCGYSGKLLRVLKHTTDPIHGPELREAIWNIRTHPVDPRILMSAGEDGRVILWNMETGNTIWCWTNCHPGGQTLINAKPGQAIALADSCFSSDGTSIAVSDGNGRWSLFATGSKKSYALAMDEQYFMDDYSPLRYDSEQVAVDESGGLMPHLLPRTPLCIHTLVPYVVQPSYDCEDYENRYRLAAQVRRRDTELEELRNQQLQQEQRQRQRRQQQQQNIHTIRNNNNNRVQYIEDISDDEDDDNNNEDESEDWEEMDEEEEDDDDDDDDDLVVEAPSPVYRRRRLRRSRRNNDDSDDDDDERIPRTRSRSTRGGRILRTRNSTVRIEDTSSSSSESPDDTDENDVENGVSGRLRPLQRRRYDVDNVPSDVDMKDDSGVSDWSAEEKEDDEDDEHASSVVWNSESSKDSFVPQVGDDVIYFPSEDRYTINLERKIRERTALRCNILSIKIERRSRNSVVAKVQVIVTSCSSLSRRPNKRRGSTSLSQTLESYHLDKFETDANVVGLTFDILFPVLKMQQSGLSPIVLSERYANSLDWAESSLKIGQIVHVPFENGIVYEGTFDPLDSNDTTASFTPWECVRVRWKNDGTTSTTTTSTTTTTISNDSDEYGSVSPWEIVESSDEKGSKNLASQLNKQSKERLMNVVQGFRRSKEFGKDFGEPVNVDIFSDYYEFVSAPMDLGTSLNIKIKYPSVECEKNTLPTHIAHSNTITKLTLRAPMQIRYIVVSQKIFIAVLRLFVLIST